MFWSSYVNILEFWIYQFFSQILDYNEEEAAEEAEHDKTPSLSFSATTDSSVRNFDHILRVNWKYNCMIEP